MKLLKPFEWSKNPANLIDGSVLKLGQVIIATTYQNAEKTWCADMWLPGIALKRLENGKQRRFETEVEAKQAAERLVHTWFGWVTQ